MPLIANNVIVKSQPDEKKVDKKQVKELSTSNRLVPSSGTVLFVDGKPRKMGKKSQYLLDMLTLDEK